MMKYMSTRWGYQIKQGFTHAMCACFLLLIFFSGDSLAATLTVPGDHATISAAITAANNGDTISVSAGTYSENINFTGKDITIQSVSGAASTTIQGSASNSAVVTFSGGETAAAILDGFTIDNQGANTDTRGIYITSGSPTIKNSIIDSNTANYRNGAGVYITGSSGATFIDTDITNNTGSNNEMGGGIHQAGTGTLSITGGSISSNFAYKGGGGIYQSAGTLTISGTTIASNNVTTGGTGGGGGIYYAGSGTLTITNAIIESNSATKYGGGGLWLNSATAIITGSTFKSNITAGDNGGGGILINGAAPSLTLSKSHLVGNRVNGNNNNSDGGGIKIAAGTATITNTVVAGNVADNAWQADGGGIFNAGILNLYFSAVADNYSYNNGGGLYAGSTENIYNSIIWGNSYGHGSGSAEIYGTTENLYLTETANDPTFVTRDAAGNGNPRTGGNYDLQSGSNSIDTGDATNAPADDIDGTSRPVNGLYDKGAYEYGAGGGNSAPLGGYNADNVIPSAQITQSGNGDGIITVNFRAQDAETDNVTLNTFQYSVDGGSSWNAPTNADASASLSADWNDGGSSYSSAADWGGIVHSFTFDTDHADVSGISGTEQSDIQVRFTVNDGTNDSASPATSENFQVDDLAPTATITSSTYDASTNTLTITGTNFTTVASASTDITSYVDWNKFVWDVNADGTTTTDITFVAGDITSLTVTDSTTLTLVFTSAKAASIEGNANFRITGGDDTLDVAAGFLKDEFGNTATTDGVSDATLSDIIAPNSVSDLSTTSATTSSVTLGWTAPGDDADALTASSYDIRYSTSTITDINWDSANQATGEPSPGAPGSSESFTVTGLSEATVYYFAIKTMDGEPNTSTLSNIASLSTSGSGNLTLHPSGAATGDNVSYSGGTAATAMDSNDGDSSYASYSGTSNDSYSEIDDTAQSGAINSVQVFALARDTSGMGAADFTIGVKTNGSSYFSSGKSTGGSYSTFSGTLYNTNPQSGSAWTWSEINNLVAIIDHTDSTALRVTELYVVIDYTSDSSAPSSVTDLATNNPTSSSVTLTWTAPGDDGASGTATSYDVRYSTSTITEGNWASATQATGEPAPSVAGSSESFTVNGLSASTAYYFAIKAIDDVGNNGALSNVPSATTQATDSTAPATITDLAAGAPGENSVQLSWTSPGDDSSSGTATSYDIRYSSSAITEGNWASATSVSGEPTPQIAGSTEYFTVTGLSASTTYYFAVKTSDEVPNTSAISNSPSATTTAAGGGSLTLHPSGAATGDNVSYSGGTAATALDTNDGDSSYGSASGSSNDFYLEIDDTSQTGSIDSVQVFALARDTSGMGAADFTIGVKTNGSSDFSSGKSTGGSYSTFSGTLYNNNPQSGAAWTWTEINDLVTIVDHTDSTALRVTELYVVVNYTPGDGTAPDAVSDLATGTLTSSSVQLNWTAPGDDGSTGSASVYDVRYSTGTITEANWEFATQVTGEPSPSVATTGETFTVTGLSDNTTYYFAIKSRDEVPNISALSNVVSAATPSANTAPLGGYSADNVIPTTQVAQSTTGDGIITVNFRAQDAETSNVTLNTFQYSVDGGSTWNAPTNGDASASLSADWTNNGSGGYSSSTDWAGTVHSFTFDTDHADATGMAGLDQADVQIRFTLNDGTDNSASAVTSENFQVDDESPADTILSATYNPFTDTMVITGTNFTTIAPASTGIKSYVDWSKFVWDINSDDATTADITFVEGDVTSLTITDATTLTLVFTASKGTAIEGTADYGSAGAADALDISTGFSKDAFGNAATTDGVNNGTLSIITYQPDTLIKISSEGDGSFLTDGAYEAAASTQVKSQGVLSGNTAVYILKFENDGDETDSLVITGTGDGSGFTVQYLDNTSTDRTADVTGAGYTIASLAASEARLWTLNVNLAATVFGAASYDVAVTATSTTDNTKTDQAKATTSSSSANVTLLKSADKTEALPGEEISYTVAASNASGLTDASNIVVADPVPDNTGFKMSGATFNAGTSTLTNSITYSSDNGSTWTYTPVDSGCSAPAGYDYCVTDVRWVTGGTMPAGTSFSVGLVVTVK